MTKDSMQLKVLFVNDHPIANKAPVHALNNALKNGLFPKGTKLLIDEVLAPDLAPFYEEATTKMLAVDIVVMDARLFDAHAFNGWHVLLPAWLNGAPKPPFGALWLETAAYHDKEHRTAIEAAATVPIRSWNECVGRALKSGKRVHHAHMNKHALAVQQDPGDRVFAEWAAECAAEIERSGRDW